MGIANPRRLAPVLSRGDARAELRDTNSIYAASGYVELGRAAAPVRPTPVAPRTRSVSREVQSRPVDRRRSRSRLSVSLQAEGRGHRDHQPRTRRRTVEPPRPRLAGCRGGADRGRVRRLRRRAEVSTELATIVADFQSPALLAQRRPLMDESRSPPAIRASVLHPPAGARATAGPRRALRGRARHVPAPASRSSPATRTAPSHRSPPRRRSSSTSAPESRGFIDDLNAAARRSDRARGRGCASSPRVSRTSDIAATLSLSQRTTARPVYIFTKTGVGSKM